MTVSVVACGSTAEGWQNIPHDYSIGVNDAFKWAHKFNALLICNHKSRFTTNRQQTILDTRPIKLYTHCESWLDDFPDHVKVKLRSYDGHLYTERLTTADTSPIIAMSLAYQIGAKTIIVHGADFVNHSTYSAHNPQTKEELRKYRGYIEALGRAGIQTYVSSKESALSEFTPVWTAK